jgi:hypothetical protein
MEQCDRIAVGRLDRHRSAAAGHGAGERDRPARRRADKNAWRPADVEPSMEPGAVGVTVEVERS